MGRNPPLPPPYPPPYAHATAPALAPTLAPTLAPALAPAPAPGPAYAKMRPYQLKAECKKLGMSQAGSKDALVARLQEYDPSTAELDSSFFRPGTKKGPPAMGKKGPP